MQRYGRHTESPRRCRTGPPAQRFTPSRRALSTPPAHSHLLAGARKRRYRAPQDARPPARAPARLLRTEACARRVAPGFAAAAPWARLYPSRGKPYVVSSGTTRARKKTNVQTRPCMHAHIRARACARWLARAHACTRTRSLVRARERARTHTRTRKVVAVLFAFDWSTGRLDRPPRKRGRHAG